jgi:hypothetical protein
MKHVIFLSIVFILFGNQAKAAPPQQNGHTTKSGMWLCLSPLIAVNFWGDVMTAQGTGIEIKASDVDSIARKNECKYFESDHFKLIDVGGSSSLQVGQPPLKVTDGNSTGWVPSQEYIEYMRYHVVRKP